LDQDENLIAAVRPTYTYSFDSMHRPVTLTDQNNYQAVNSVTYRVASQLLTMSYFGVSETRTYNNMLQMTRLSIPGQVDISYTFPSATTNNGKINSQTDNISGETVTYQYDSLNRLSAANGSGWNQNFGYDGFGNLVSKTGSNSPALSIAIDAPTNHVVGQSYDFNGNQASTPTLGASLSYDPENRLLTAPGVRYAYDTQNKRIWKGTFDGNGYLTGQWLYFYGIDGQKLGTYYLTADYGQTWGPVLWDQPLTTAVFFGGKRVAVDGVAFVPDRLGSKGKYYPYGEERNSPPLANDQVKFATYTRDSATGLDYADQRYYTNTHGRFMSPDPYKASGGASDPGSWNRYAYVGGDPVNYDDPNGLERVSLEDKFWTCFFGKPFYADPEIWMATCMAGDTTQSAVPERVLPSSEERRWNKGLSNLSLGNDLLHRTLKGTPSDACQKDLDAIQELGVSTLGIVLAADVVQWNDAWGDDTLAIGLFVPGSPDYIMQQQHGPNETISQYVSGNKSGGTTAATALPGSALWGNIYFSSSFAAGLSISDAAALLMHELIHSLGPTDKQIQAALFGAKSPEVGASTHNISVKLGKDCFQ